MTHFRTVGRGSASGSQGSDGRIGAHAKITFRIPPSTILPFHLSGVKSEEVEGQTFDYFASFFAVQSRD